MAQTPIGLCLPLVPRLWCRAPAPPGQQTDQSPLHSSKKKKKKKKKYVLPEIPAFRCRRLERRSQALTVPPPTHPQGNSPHARAKYKQALDPTVEDVKKLCISLRRNAKTDRLLLHYNGHGVPRPTSSGEVWVFNKNFTQYIPLSIYELRSWVRHAYLHDILLLSYHTHDSGEVM
jgi:hypothetical protein